MRVALGRVRKQSGSRGAERSGAWVIVVRGPTMPVARRDRVASQVGNFAFVGPVADAMTSSRGSQAPVSVVIPLGPRLEGIERCLESVAAQSRAPAEVIVVHDGPAQIDLTGTRMPAGTTLRMLEHPVCRGGGVARNTGLSASTQEFVAFLDSDDEWTPDRLEVDLSAMGSAGAMVSGAVRVRDGRRESPARRGHCSSPERVLRFDDWQLAVTSSLTVRRATAPWWDEALPAMQDWDYLVQLLDVTEVVTSDHAHTVIHQSSVGPRVFEGDRRALGLAQVATKYADRLRRDNEASREMVRRLRRATAQADEAETRLATFQALAAVSGHARWRVWAAANALVPRAVGPAIRAQMVPRRLARRVRKTLRAAGVRR